MGGGAAVGVDDDLAAGEAGSRHPGPPMYELAGRVDVEQTVLVGASSLPAASSADDTGSTRSRTSSCEVRSSIRCWVRDDDLQVHADRLAVFGIGCVTWLLESGPKGVPPSVPA